MTNIEYIKELDKRIEQINLQWSGEVSEILKSKKNVKNPAWGEEKIKEINNGYAVLLAEVIDERQKAYDKEYQVQLKAYEDEFVPKIPENSQSVDKIRIDGQWIDRKNKEE